MSKKSISDFINSKTIKSKNTWKIHECSFCKYPCSFMWTKTLELFYDNGCECSKTTPNFRKTSWEEIVDIYNMNINSPVKKEYDEFWGFT